MKQTNFTLTIIIALIFHGLARGQAVPNEEDWEKLPVSIDPGTSSFPPSDAVVLFDGTDLANWVDADGKKSGWKVKNGVLTVAPGKGDIYSKNAFGDVQMHAEWMIPEKKHGNGNSGIYMQGRYEVQIFNSYKDESKIYYNGQTGSLYKQHSPLVNASKPKGEWNSFDILFTAPRFDDNGKLISPAIFTVFHNGVLIQYNAKLKGTTTHGKTTLYEPHELKQPIMIQDHGDPVQFRNIWIREL